MLKIIVAGGRDFNDYCLLEKTLDQFLQDRQFIDSVEIVSGLAKGADLLGKKYAEERHINCREFPANWDLYGKSAGYRRNGEMANYADIAICFWDGQSKGTKHMIDTMQKQGKFVKIIRYN